MKTIIHYFNNLILKKHFFSILLLALCALITLQNISLGVHHFWEGNYTHYNNYVIFKSSFNNLINNENLYVRHVDQYADLFKYSPTFALAMGIFAYLPDTIGLFLWNCLNVFIFYYALYTIKLLDTRGRLCVMFFILIELVSTTQFSQSNALLTALMILTYNKLEKGENIKAACIIAIGTFIKIYSVLGCLLLFLYPNKIRSFIGLLGSSAILLTLPLLLVTQQDLIQQYQNWQTMLQQDYFTSDGMSVYKYSKVLGLNEYKKFTVIVGIILVITPLFFLKQNKSIWRLKYLCLLLIYLVVFNHKSEASTYIIAVTGVVIWYSVSKANNFQKLILFLTLFFTSIWFTDILPPETRKKIIEPDLVRPFMCTITALIIFYELIFTKQNMQNEIKEHLR